MASRRDYGSGGMRKRGKKWQATYRLPPDPITGKRARKTFTAGTKQEVLKLRETFRQRVERGLDVAGAQSTLAAYFDRWLRDHAARSVTPRTLKGYEQTGRVFVAPIGGIRLADLKPHDVERALAEYLGTGRSRRTAAKHLTVLRSGLTHAVRLQLIPSNPASVVTKPRSESREMNVADAVLLNELLAACRDDDFRRLIYVAVDSGMRAGELLGLRWSDLNWARSIVQVQRSRNSFAATGFAEPKTKASRRTIVLSATGLELLRVHRIAQNERRLLLGSAWPENDLVFARSDGSPDDVSNLSRRWVLLCKRAGVSGLRFHDLRHTSATMALARGIHPKVVQERLGHSTIGITLDTYSHVLPSMQEDAAERMGDALSGLNVSGI